MNGGPMAMADRGRHLPVMVDEVVASIRPRDDGLYVDGTFGDGGYSRAMLDAAGCRVLAIDRDPDAVRRGAPLAARYAGRLDLVQGRFGDMAALLRVREVAKVDGIALDLGVSSAQLAEPERGFSFRLDGPLDMRMDGAGSSAADTVNSASEEELAHILRDYGDERHARRIARAIVAARSKQPITRTDALASLVRSVVPAARDGLDPATRTFQALRIHVNDELGELDRGLAAAEQLLAPGGRLVVVSFHSLEDRRVKTFLRARAGAGPRTSRHLPATAGEPAPSFILVHRGAVMPSPDEIKANPRARSARLRAAERTAAAAWSQATQGHGGTA